jgi:iduronate 2-sulfatase
MKIPLLLTALFAISATAAKPNVLLLLVDDLKPALGCYGDAIAKSPQIDKLAARAMRFDKAYCNQSVCAPSRFTLMLGSHSSSTGLYGLGSQLRQVIPDAVTMPQHFAAQGYRTESLGKIFHIGHGNNGDPESFSVPHFKEKVIEYADPASTEGGKLTREEAYFTNQKLGQIRSLPRGAAYESPSVPDEAYADGRVAAETIRRLEAAKARKVPFFIAAGFARPHLPFSAPKRYWDLYDPADLPMPRIESLPANSAGVGHKRGGEICNYFPAPNHGEAQEFSPELKRKLVHGYYASVSYVDAQIGKVVDALDRLGLAENTIIVLWGDHGFHLGDLGVWTKHTNYEQANRIPILIAAPGIQPGATNQPAESVDIFPTLADLAGLPAPIGPQPIDGVSLAPVLRSPQSRVRGHAYHCYPRSLLGRAIRTERFRLVEWRRPGSARDTAQIELYDYSESEVERANVASNHPEVVQRLRAILDTYPEAVSKSRRKPKPKSATKAPAIANSALTISAKIRADKPQGVVLAQGGDQYGFALHFVDGKPAFDVRIHRKATRIIADSAASGELNLKAMLTAERMTLSVDGKEVASGASPGLIPVQPQDGLSIGKDDESAAGNYDAPNPFVGKILATSVKPRR